MLFVEEKGQEEVSEIYITRTEKNSLEFGGFQGFFSGPIFRQLLIQRKSENFAGPKKTPWNPLNFTGFFSGPVRCRSSGIFQGGFFWATFRISDRGLLTFWFDF